jgi:hypothetical protein
MEPIIRVPNPLTLSVRYFSEEDRSSLIRDFQKFNFNLTEADLLTMFIGSEKGRPESFWAPYFSFIEEQTHFWNAHHFVPAELEALEGTFALQLVMEERQRLQSINEVLETIAAENKAQPSVTMEQLMFGRSLLVGHSMLGVGGQRIHVPGLSLLRYSPFLKHANRQPTFKFRKGRDGDPVLVAFDVGGHLEGEEIFQSMVQLSNAESLRDFGLAFLQNPHDYVQIVLGGAQAQLSSAHPNRDHQWDKRLAVLRGQGLARAVRISSSTMPAAVLQVCRVLKASEAELEAVIRGEVTLELLSDSVEEACWDELQAAVQELEGKYPHTVDDDKLQLAQMGTDAGTDDDNEHEWALDLPTTRIRRLVLVRMGERQVLDGFKGRLQDERQDWERLAQSRGYVCAAPEGAKEWAERETAHKKYAAAAEKARKAKASAAVEVLARQQEAIRMKEVAAAKVAAAAKEVTVAKERERILLENKERKEAAERHTEREKILQLAKASAEVQQDQAAAGSDAPTNSGTDSHPPCECAADGVSGGQQTDIKGCGKSPQNTELAGLGTVCYVVDPAGCGESRGSGTFPGAEWRFCS